MIVIHIPVSASHRPPLSTVRYITSPSNHLRIVINGTHAAVTPNATGHTAITRQGNYSVCSWSFLNSVSRAAPPVLSCTSHTNHYFWVRLHHTTLITPHILHVFPQTSSRSAGHCFVWIASNLLVGSSSLPCDWRRHMHNSGTGSCNIMNEVVLMRCHCVDVLLESPVGFVQLVILWRR